MRKIFGICICLLLLVGVIVAPTAAFAAENAPSAAVTIHFLNPTAVAFVDNKLFVADNIDEHNSAIHCFDVTESKAKWLYTQSMTEEIVNLSTAVKNEGENSLYVVFASQIGEYTVGATKLTEAAKITAYPNPVDVTYGVDGISSKNEYILTDNELYRNNIGRATTTAITGTKSCVAIGDYVYYLYTDNGADICKSFEGRNHTTPDANTNTPQGYLNGSDPTSSGYFLKDFAARGLFVWENDKVAIFNDERVCYVNMSETCTLSSVFNYADAQQNQENKKQIVYVATSDSRLYVLNDNYQVDIFQSADNGFERIDTVGDDTVTLQTPTQYTSFTLARPTGYPTNLVYKTTDEASSIEEIIKNASEYIILGFDGDENSAYYYVLVGNKFGWVQKSADASIDGNGNIVDESLEIVDTKVSNDTVGYTSKFASLNAVYIYKLPRSDDSFRDETFTQTASNMPDVNVAQRFTEGDTVWYYVSFKDGDVTRTGFVQEKDLGKFAIKVDEDKIHAIDDKKINSSLFEAVKLYLYGDKELMTDDNLVTTEDGVVKLYSGKRVTLISEENGVSFIQIVNSDGSSIYGYVFSDRLIGIHAMTTNAIVGLSMLAVAIVLAVALIAVFVKRKNGTAPKHKKETKAE